MKRRIHSYVWSGIVALAVLIGGICFAVSQAQYIHILTFFGVAIASFCMMSCLILNNNFVGEMMLEIFSWGFVKLPFIIFTLDFDGLIFLLVVKVIFWILGFILAILCAILAIAIGLLVSLFVYPYALYKNIKYGDTD